MSSDAPDDRGADVLQRLHLAPIDAVPGGLYATTTGHVRCARNAAQLAPWSSLSTATYFGRVPASYLQRWTTVEALEVVATVRGRGRVEVVAQDHLPGTRVVAHVDVDTVDPVTVRLPARLDAYLQSGHLWLEAATTEAELEISDVRVECPAAAGRRSVFVVICTYNRPDDCAATLARIASDATALGLVDRIIVVDQGERRVVDAPGFEATRESLGDRLEIIEQPNRGGAGGFTRGMIEARSHAGAEPGSVILMDDDIRLEPDSLARLVAFDAHRRQPLIVGGQMLNLRHPSVLLSHGEQTELVDLKLGRPVLPELQQVDLLESLPTRRIDVEYNAWWLCLVPLEVVETVGLPVPVFFQGDDCEFGLRARSKGVLTVTLPGAAVWHQDFDFKDWDSPLAYFAIRNALINAALHTDLVPGGIRERLEARLRHQLLEHRYGLTVTVLSAIEAFLDGPETLSAGGVHDLREAVRLREAYPDTHSLSAEQLREQDLDRVRLSVEYWHPDDAERASVRRIISQLRGRMAPEVALMAGAPWWLASSFRTVVAIDQSQDAFRVRRYSRSESVRLMRESRRVLRRLRKEGPGVVEQWRAALPELTSEESWRTVFADPT